MNCTWIISGKVAWSALTNQGSLIFQPLLPATGPTFWPEQESVVDAKLDTASSKVKSEVLSNRRGGRVGGPSYTVLRMLDFDNCPAQLHLRFCCDNVIIWQILFVLRVLVGSNFFLLCEGLRTSTRPEREIRVIRDLLQPCKVQLHYDMTTVKGIANFF